MEISNITGKICKWTVISAAAIVIEYSIYSFPVEKADVKLLLLALITVFLGAKTQIQLPRTKIHLSVAESLIYFTMLVYDVRIAVLLAGLETIYASYAMRRRHINIKISTIFLNSAFTTLATISAGIALKSLFSVSAIVVIQNDLQTLVAALSVIALVHFLVNSVLVAFFISLRNEKSFMSVWNENCFNALIMYAFAAVIAGLMVFAFSTVNLILLLVTISISVLIYVTYRRYVDDIKKTSVKAEQAERERAELAENHVIELQRFVDKLKHRSIALRESKKRFKHAAFHDALTDLPNRSMFLERLKILIERNKKQKDVKFAVLFLDLNRFKRINDSLGHFTGNELLLNIAKRLSNLVRENDLVARFSGDEFAIILSDVSNSEETTAFAELVSQKISVPYNLNGRKVFTSVSIGIAMFDPRYSEAEDILRDADIAMYEAKETNKKFVVFDQKMHTRAVTLLEIETDLQNAVERNEMVTYYQPLIDLHNMEIIGFEALMRWNHPQRGLVPPGEFISVCEETGLIIPLTLWILRDSCQQLVKWEKKFPFYKKLVMSVNLSGKHFSEPDLVEQIMQIVKETNIRPECLKLEITESAVMENAEIAIRMLRQFRELGINISVDDFGTGHSSLSYLHRFPINTLKIDRSFVNSMEDEIENGEIVRTIIALAKSLNLDVIAEGIETTRQLEQLKILDCEYGQGFLFSRPVPEREIEQILAKEGLWKNIIPGRTDIIPYNHQFTHKSLNR